MHLDRWSVCAYLEAQEMSVHGVPQAITSNGSEWLQNVSKPCTACGYYPITRTLEDSLLLCYKNINGYPGRNKPERRKRMTKPRKAQQGKPVCCHTVKVVARLLCNVCHFLARCVCVCTDSQVGGASIATPTELLGQLDSNTSAQLDPCRSIATCGDGNEHSTLACGYGDRDAEAGVEDQPTGTHDNDVRKDDGDQQEATGSMEIEDRPSVDVLGR